MAKLAEVVRQRFEVEPPTAATEEEASPTARWASLSRSERYGLVKSLYDPRGDRPPNHGSVIPDGYLTMREVALRLGVSAKTVSDVWCDPDGLKARVKKESYAGVCEDCGGPTRGDSTKVKSRRCSTCARVARQEEAARAWPVEEVLAAIQAWVAVVGHPPTANEWANVNRFDPEVWPTMTHIVKRCGTLGRAIAMAGFEPRSRGRKPPPGWRRAGYNSFGGWNDYSRDEEIARAMRAWLAAVAVASHAC